MNTKQKGFTLAEITIAVSVIAALIIPSLDFYDKSIAKASLAGVFPAVAEVMNAVQEHYAYHGDLPNDGGSGDGVALLDGALTMQPISAALGRITVIESATWNTANPNSTFNDANTQAIGASQLATEVGGADWGYVEVHLKDNNTIHQTLRNKTLRFYFIESENRNKIEKKEKEIVHRPKFTVHPRGFGQIGGIESHVSNQNIAGIDGDECHCWF